MPSTAGRIHYKTAPGQLGFEVAVPQGPAKRSNPLGALEPTHVLIEQLYMQRADAYARPPENDLCPADISLGRAAYFIDDSPREPAGRADIVTFTRSWATIPLTYYDYSSLSVIYPAYGLVTTGGIITSGERPEYEASPRCRIDNEFFLIGAAGRYPNADSIPSLDETILTYSANNTTNPNAVFRMLRGGFVIYNAFNTLNGSVPTLTTYKGWVTTDAANAGSYSLIAEQSSQDRYLGNIFRRSTIRVKAR